MWKGGIGEALAKEYTSRGLSTIATVLPSESSDHLTEAGITCFQLDLTVPQSILDLKQNVQSLTHGRLDVLVNNAGLCYTMTAIDTEIVPVRRMFDVNLFGPIQMVHHFHEMLIRSQGAIVNIGSIGGIVPYMYGGMADTRPLNLYMWAPRTHASLPASYNASKAALHHWSNTLRLEMSPFKYELTTRARKSHSKRTGGDDSYYAPLASEFKAHVRRVPNTTNRFQYAEKVANESLKPSPAAWFWYGKTTSIIRFFDTFAWRTFWDLVFWRDFNLAKLRDAHLARMRG
ncbi:hypothetical protein PG988_015504 [Apiospora saccharicola]